MAPSISMTKPGQPCARIIGIRWADRAQGLCT
jgi:hypothetical protein